MIRGKKEPKSDSGADSRPGIITALDRGDYYGGEGVEPTKQPPNPMTLKYIGQILSVSFQVQVKDMGYVQGSLETISL